MSRPIPTPRPSGRTAAPRLAAVLVAAALATGLAAACTTGGGDVGGGADSADSAGPTPGPAPAGGAPTYVIDVMPAGFAPSAAVELPAELPDPEAFALTVVQDADRGATVGVFRRTDDSPGPPPGTGAGDGGAVVLGPVGPEGLVAASAPSVDGEVRLVSRDLTEAQLVELTGSVAAAGLDDALPASAWTRIAAQSPAAVPGIGSLPLPPAAGSAASWVREPTGDEPVRGSIGVGAHTSTGDDLAVLRWWLDTGGSGGDLADGTEEPRRLRTRFPAYEQIGDPGAGDPAVPEATLAAWTEGDVVVVVRLVGVADEDIDAVLASVRPATPAEWAELRAGADGADHRTVLISGADPAWELLLEGGDDPQLCVEARGPRQTDRSCVGAGDATLRAGGPVARLVPSGSSTVVLYGTAPAGTTAVTVRDTSGEIARVAPVSASVGPAFAVALPTGPDVAVVALDAAGRELVTAIGRRPTG